MRATDQALVYVSCGRGRRVAHLDHVDQVDGYLFGQVWIDRAHRWSRLERIRPSRIILGGIDRRDPVVRRAIRSVTPGHPSCRHSNHQAVAL